MSKTPPAKKLRQSSIIDSFKTQAKLVKEKSLSKKEHKSESETEDPKADHLIDKKANLSSTKFFFQKYLFLY